MSVEEKKERFVKLSLQIQEYEPTTQLGNTTKVVARQTIALILNSIQQLRNYDGTNGVYADDLLMYLCHLKIDEAMEVVIEQLADVIISGQCGQGRTHRLIQLCSALKEQPP